MRTILFLEVISVKKSYTKQQKTEYIFELNVKENDIHTFNNRILLI